METEKAYLALGCFWGPDEYFSKLPGIIKTRVGYSGGSTDNPTYDNIGNHSETIEIEFAPEQITYPEILEHFFSEHDPASVEIRQYRSAIFYLDEDQRRTAEEEKKKIEEKLGWKITTKIEPLTKFFRAEEYHQKYFEKMKKYDKENS